jgi:probable HAF family extracellular repeat protein
MKRVVLAASVALVLASGAVQAAPSYLVTDLGSLLNVVSINDSGWMVGTSYSSTGNNHGLLYSGGGMTDLGNLGYGRATAINNSGEIVGYSFSYGDTTHAKLYRPFLYSGGHMNELGFGSNHDYAGAYAINNSGQIVGNFLSGHPGEHMPSNALLYSGGKITDIGDLGGGETSGSDINDNGHIVGESERANHYYQYHAFLYTSSSGMTDLGTLGGSTSSASNINNSDQVVGTADTTDGAQHAFLYSAGNMRDLGTLGGDYSLAYAINNSGQIVGYSATVQSTSEQPVHHAFLYSNGSMADLNSLTDPLSGWTITGAVDINNSGQIAAHGCRGSVCHTLLLNPIPIPEPETYAMMLAGLGLIGVRMRSRRRTSVGVLAQRSGMSRASTPWSSSLCRW